jgi:hypothetical protein
MNRRILKSKRTGRRFVAVRRRPSVGTDSIKVVPEEDYQDYLNNIHYGLTGSYEGYSPWLVPVNDLEDTGEVYTPKQANNKVKEYWK